jgi:hypothetical protein
MEWQRTKRAAPRNFSSSETSLAGTSFLGWVMDFFTLPG